MVLNMCTNDEISPTLREIVDQFDENSRRPSDTFSSGQKSAEQVYEGGSNSNDAEFDGDAYDNCGTWAFDHDDQASVVGEDCYGGDPTLPSHYQVLYSCYWNMSSAKSCFWACIRHFLIDLDPDVSLNGCTLGKILSADFHFIGSHYEVITFEQVMNT